MSEIELTKKEAAQIVKDLHKCAVSKVIKRTNYFLLTTPTPLLPNEEYVEELTQDIISELNRELLGNNFTQHDRYNLTKLVGVLVRYLDVDIDADAIVSSFLNDNLDF